VGKFWRARPSRHALCAKARPSQDLGRRVSKEYGPKARVVAKKVWEEAQRIVRSQASANKEESAVTDRFQKFRDDGRGPAR